MGAGEAGAGVGGRAVEDGGGGAGVDGCGVGWGESCAGVGCVGWRDCDGNGGGVGGLFEVDGLWERMTLGDGCACA